MKFEMKIFLLSCLLSLSFMGIFTYFTTIGEKTIYVYQVGIYKEEKNKNSKINELQKEGYNGYYYEKDSQYYVLSLITENEKEIKEHSQKVKGIIKEYTVDSDITTDKFLESLQDGNQI